VGDINKARGELTEQKREIAKLREELGMKRSEIVALKEQLYRADCETREMKGKL